MRMTSERMMITRLQSRAERGVPARATRDFLLFFLQFVFSDCLLLSAVLYCGRKRERRFTFSMRFKFFCCHDIGGSCMGNSMISLLSLGWNFIRGIERKTQKYSEKQFFYLVCEKSAIFLLQKLFFLPLNSFLKIMTCFLPRGNVSDTHAEHIQTGGNDDEEQP